MRGRVNATLAVGLFIAAASAATAARGVFHGQDTDREFRGRRPATSSCSWAMAWGFQPSRPRACIPLVWLVS